jgi:hypothetical protein
VQVDGGEVASVALAAATGCHILAVVAVGRPGLVAPLVKQVALAGQALL